MFIGENYTPLSHGYFPSGYSLDKGSQTLVEELSSASLTIGMMEQWNSGFWDSATMD